MSAARTARPEDRPRISSGPAEAFDLCTLETEDAEMQRITRATYEAGPARTVGENQHVHVLAAIATAAAHLGRADHVKIILPNQIRCLVAKGDFVDPIASGEPVVMANRMTLREGPGTTECQRLGRVAAGLHEALLQSSPPAPGKQPILHVFGAWPKEWDAEFTLLARGSFLVTSAIQRGQIEFIELLSRAGGECRVRNPWGENAVTVHRNGKGAEQLSGSLLTFATAKDERIVIVPRGATLEKIRRTVKV
jgi:hypothetical protein